MVAEFVEDAAAVIAYRRRIPRVLFKIKRMKRDGTIMIVPARCSHLRESGQLDPTDEELRQFKYSVHPSMQAAGTYSKIKIESVARSGRIVQVVHNATTALKENGVFAVIAGHRFSDLGDDLHHVADIGGSCVWVGADVETNIILACVLVSSTKTFVPNQLAQRFDCYVAKYEYFNLHFLFQYVHLPAHSNQSDVFFIPEGAETVSEAPTCVVRDSYRQVSIPPPFAFKAREASAVSATLIDKLIVECQEILDRDVEASPLLYAPRILDFGPNPYPTTMEQVHWEMSYKSALGSAHANFMMALSEI